MGRTDVPQTLVQDSFVLAAVEVKAEMAEVGRTDEELALALLLWLFWLFLALGRRIVHFQNLL